LFFEAAKFARTKFCRSPSVAVGRACPHHARPKQFFDALPARGGASRDPSSFLIMEREAAELFFPKKIFVFKDKKS
jgi:hypothetical protein